MQNYKGSSCQKKTKKIKHTVRCNSTYGFSEENQQRKQPWLELSDSNTETGIAMTALFDKGSLRLLNSIRDAQVNTYIYDSPFVLCLVNQGDSSNITNKLTFQLAYLWVPLILL